MLIPIAVLAYTLHLTGTLGPAVTHGPMSNRVLLVVIGSVAAIAALFTQVKLITEVREEGLSIRFFLLWKQRVIPWHSIESVEAVMYNPVQEFGGWDVQWAATAWLTTRAARRACGFA